MTYLVHSIEWSVGRQIGALFFPAATALLVALVLAAGTRRVWKKFTRRR
jgi:hypothetical protein